MDYTPPENAAEARDRWKAWVFSLSGEGWFSGEESYKGRHGYGSFSTNRVTPGSKLRLGLSIQQEKKRYDIEDDTGGVTTITGLSSSWDASGLYVKSLGEHWSAGVYIEAESSYYANVDLGLRFAPAVEYNVFPYSQSTPRQLRILYRLGYRGVRYREETIYFKTRESLWMEPVRGQSRYILRTGLLFIRVLHVRNERSHHRQRTCELCRAHHFLYGCQGLWQRV